MTAMNDFRKYLNDFFVKYLAETRGMSRNTSQNYRDTMVQFLQFMEEIKHINPEKLQMTDICHENVSGFLDWLENSKEVSISTRNNRLAGIKSFAKYVERHEPKYLELCSGILGIQAKKNVQKPMNYLTIPAFENLLSVFDRTDPHELRDLCIVSLLYESGARVSELTEIKRYELRTTSPETLVLHGKGNKTRVVPVDRSVAKLLTEYIGKYKIQPNEYLFFNSGRKRLTRKGIEYILKKYFDRAKQSNPTLFPDTISPHCLRHSRAMHLLENNVNLIYIRDLLGHSSVTTTEIYSKANPEIKRKHIQDATKQLIDTEDYNQVEKNDLIEWLKKNI